MEVNFKTSSLRKLLESQTKLKQKHPKYYKDIMSTLNQLIVLDNLYSIRINHQFRLHTLSWKNKWEMSMNVKMWDKTVWLRFVIEWENWEDVCNDFHNLEIFKTITKINIISLIDYH